MQEKRKRVYFVLLITAALLLVGALLAFAVQKGLHIPCPVHALTRLSCAGCGNTRAVMALLQLRFLDALRYNYLFPLEIGYCVFFYVRCCIQFIFNGKFIYRSPSPALEWGMLAALVVWTILRNILHI